MSVKTVIVLVDGTPESVERARHAVNICRKFGAHLVGVFVAPSGWERIPAESYAVGKAAIQAVIERWRAFAEMATDSVIQAFERTIRHQEIPFEFRTVPECEMDAFFNLHCLHADLVIAGVRQLNASPAFMPKIEALHAASGIPLLLVPEGWHGDSVGENIMLGWNASREARRAITVALPGLVAAQSVHVVIVDAKKNPRLGEEPGSDVGLMLTRHGAKVTVHNLSSKGAPVADVMLDFATGNALDLLVIGAYSHSMTRERLFGGVTRTLLQRTRVPLLAAY